MNCKHSGQKISLRRTMSSLVDEKDLETNSLDGRIARDT